MSDHKYYVDIDVVTRYLALQSSVEQQRHVFSYSITITNCSTEPVKLLRRQWLIVDANERRQEVEGEGVVGQQPHLDVGESFSYTSGAVIATEVGTMEGSYFLVGDSGEEFEAPIEPFLLANRAALH